MFSIQCIAAQPRSAIAHRDALGSSPIDRADRELAETKSRLEKVEKRLKKAESDYEKAEKKLEEARENLRQVIFAARDVCFFASLFPHLVLSSFNYRVKALLTARSTF